MRAKFTFNFGRRASLQSCATNNSHREFAKAILQKSRFENWVYGLSETETPLRAESFDEPKNLF